MNMKFIFSFIFSGFGGVRGHHSKGFQEKTVDATGPKPLNMKPKKEPVLVTFRISYSIIFGVHPKSRFRASGSLAPGRKWRPGKKLKALI